MMKQMRAKDVFGRMPKHFEAVADLINSEPPLYPATTLEEIHQAHNDVGANAVDLWREGAVLFGNDSYARATFLAITCIEEAGKGGVALHHALAWWANGRSKADPSARPSRRSALYSHGEKHLLAAAAGALINTRLDRVLGIERAISFYEDVEGGKLERLRQSCLYADRTKYGIEIPEQVVRRQEALEYLVFAGEIMAEVLTYGPEAFAALLKEVSEFERTYGLGSGSSPRPSDASNVGSDNERTE